MLGNGEDIFKNLKFPQSPSTATYLYSKIYLDCHHTKSSLFATTTKDYACLRWIPLKQLGHRRVLVIEHGEAYILNRDFGQRGIDFIFAWPVSHPRPTPTTKGVPGTLIITRRGDQDLEHLADCKPFEANEDDLKVKKWLENHGLKDVPFVAVPDPLYKYDEYGTDCDWDRM